MTDHNIFIILYGVTSVYFAGVMVRLMLVLAPVMCILSGIAVSSSLSTYMKYLDGGSGGLTTSVGNGAVEHSKKSVVSIGGGKGVAGGKWSSGKGGSEEGKSQKEMVATAFVTMLTFFLVTYAFHCVWATSEAYSSPSIVLTARTHDGKYNETSIFLGIDQLA